MKLLRLLPLLLALALLSGCSLYAQCVEQNAEGSYVLTLPGSGEVLEVREEYVSCLPYVTDALVRAAEEKIANEVSKQEGEAHYWITEDEAGYLCLAAEQIIRLPVDPNAQPQSGCDIDHKHLYFQERIST